MEQKFNASIDKVFSLLTNPKWLEERSLALGELSAKVRKKQSAKALSLSMLRRVKRELPALIATILPSESDIQFEESWTHDPEGGYQGLLTMEIVGQPVKMQAKFELTGAGPGCCYRIEHQTKCDIPLVGGMVAQFAQGQIEQGCADELAYLAAQLKKSR